jgi:hypothetical protein
MAARQEQIPSSGNPSMSADRDHKTKENPGKEQPTVVAGVTPALGLRPPHRVTPATTFSSRLSGVLTLIVALHPDTIRQYG